MLPPKFWHVSAGKSGRDYSDIFLEHDVMFIGPGDGGPYPTNAYEGIGSLRRFHDKVDPGDIVLMRRGADVIAIGVTHAAGYQHLSAFDDIYGWQLQHTRRVVWQVLAKPLPLFASRPRMSRFGRVKNPTPELVELARECKERELLPLPDAPSAILSPRDLLPELTAAGLTNAAEVCKVLEDHQKLLWWYHQNAETRPNEHEVVAYLVVPLLRALGWSETQLAIEWTVGKKAVKSLRSVGRLGRADLAAFDAPSRAPERCVMLCEAKALSSGLGDTLPQPVHYADKLPNCRRILTTQGSRFGIYLRLPDGSWPTRPDHYLNVARLRTQHAFPRGTNAVAALLALTPASVGAAFVGDNADAQPGGEPGEGPGTVESGGPQRSLRTGA